MMTEYNEILEAGRKFTDKILDEIDTEYHEMEKREGIYEITGEHHRIWLHRFTVLFESDNYHVEKISDERILVRKVRGDI